jgi:DNA gyrase/topoisomerase IV subunit A
MAFQDFVEEVQVLGKDLVEKVKALVHEGNVRRIIVRDEHGNTFVEIPVTVAAVGAVLAPVLAALSTIAALVSKFTVVVVRTDEKQPSAGEKSSAT